MKEDLKTIFFMGLGAISETNEKMKEVKDELYTKGKELYEKGLVANEELQRNISDKIKDNVTVVHVNSNTSKEEILKNIHNLSDKERAEILAELKKESPKK